MSASLKTPPVDDQRVGAALRAIRLRKRLRQLDIAEQANISRQLISAVERGELDQVSLSKLRSLARVLGARVDVIVRWRGADVDRLVSGRHAAMQDLAARLFGSLEGWLFTQEASYSIYGERGVIDLLAWHRASRAVLVVELKTVLVDMNDLVAQMDRRRRLARTIAAERGWNAASTSLWVIVEDSRANRRRLAAHSALLRHAFPTDGRSVRPWLRMPGPTIAALSFLSIVGEAGTAHGLSGNQRARAGSRVRAKHEDAPRAPDSPRVGVTFRG